jgi:hypothetical protein
VDSQFFDIDPSGNLTFKRNSVGLQRLLVFSTPGNTTFTKASFPGLTRLRVRAVGGGGGASGAAADAGEGVARTGGGGGAYSESVLDATAIGASETITVGAGGAGGTGNVAGVDGGASSFGGLVTAPGGRGSTPTMASGTAQAIVPGGNQANAGTGQIALPGGNGGAALRISGTFVLPGHGGDAGGGMGAGGAVNGNNLNGVDGSVYGGGGGGASSASGTVRIGGDGANGVVLVELYY